MNIDFNNFIKTSYNSEYNIINNLHYPTKSIYMCRNLGKEITAPNKADTGKPHTYKSNIFQCLMIKNYFMNTVQIY